MNHTFCIRLAAGVLALGCGWIAYTQNQGKQPPAPTPLNTIKVADDLYMLEGSGGNVAIYVTDEGVILVDDKFTQDFDNIVAGVKKVTDKPIKYVMSTHHHGDHTGSSEKFLPFAEIIAHRNNRENIVKNKQSGAPRVVFSDEADVFLGGKEVRAKHFGRGHTNGDAVIFFPGRRTIHTGDLMAGATPLIDYANGGSLKEWANTLDGVLRNDFDTVIPGHGPVQKKADLLTYRNNVEALRNRVSGLVREGKSKEDISKVLVSDYKWDPNGLQMRVGLDGMLTELKN